MFVAEALHPYNVFTEEGFDVDFVSETGTYEPDWLSQQDEWLKREDKAAWEGKTRDFREKLDGMAKAGDVDPDKVGRCSRCPYMHEHILQIRYATTRYRTKQARWMRASAGRVFAY